MRIERTALLIILLLPVFGLVDALAEESTKDTVRTLEAINIEGELTIPQVLFITSRDHPRHRDGLRERYRKSALEIGRETVFPRRFRTLAGHPQPQK